MDTPNRSNNPDISSTLEKGEGRYDDYSAEFRSYVKKFSDLIQCEIVHYEGRFNITYESYKLFEGFGVSKKFWRKRLKRDEGVPSFRRLPELLKLDGISFDRKLDIGEIILVRRIFNKLSDSIYFFDNVRNPTQPAPFNVIRTIVSKINLHHKEFKFFIDFFSPLEKLNIIKLMFDIGGTNRPGLQQMYSDLFIHYYKSFGRKGIELAINHIKNSLNVEGVTDKIKEFLVGPLSDRIFVLEILEKSAYEQNDMETIIELITLRIENNESQDIKGSYNNVLTLIKNGNYENAFLIIRVLLSKTNEALPLGFLSEFYDLLLLQGQIFHFEYFTQILIASYGNEYSQDLFAIKEIEAKTLSLSSDFMMPSRIKNLFNIYMYYKRANYISMLKSIESFIERKSKEWPDMSLILECIKTGEMDAILNYAPNPDRWYLDVIADYSIIMNRPETMLNTALYLLHNTDIHDNSKNDYTGRLMQYVRSVIKYFLSKKMLREVCEILAHIPLKVLYVIPIIEDLSYLNMEEILSSQ